MTAPKLPIAFRLLLVFCCAAPLFTLRAASGVVDKGTLRFSYDERGITGLGSRDEANQDHPAPPALSKFDL